MLSSREPLLVQDDAGNAAGSLDRDTLIDAVWGHRRRLRRLQLRRWLMAGVNETVVPTGQQRHLRQMSGWRLALLLVSPYLLVQFIHEVAPGLFPNFFSVVGEDQVIPFRDWANRSLLYLKNEDLLGLFNFKDFTRAVSGWLEYPLDVSEQLLIAGGGPFGLGAVPWVTLVAGFAVAGAWLGGWRLSLLVGACSLYLAIFDVWDDSMITLSIVVVVAPVAAVIGWALGLAASKSKRFESFLAPALNVMQSMPHFSYLLPISVFIGIGDEAGAIATILFAVPPMARLTLLGLQTVPDEVLEAGLMSGCNRWPDAVESRNAGGASATDGGNQPGIDAVLWHDSAGIVCWHPRVWVCRCSIICRAFASGEPLKWARPSC